MPQPSDFWPDSGLRHLRRDARGWLPPSDDYLRGWLARPELALVPESCAEERRLHQALTQTPALAVAPERIAALADADARDNYRMFLAFRDALLAAGTLEGCYLRLFRGGDITIPPLFIDLLAQAILHNLLDPGTGTLDPYEARAAEMLFRPQRIALQEGRVLAADQQQVDLLRDTGGLGDIGRLLLQANAPLRAVQLEVLGDDNAGRYLAGGTRFNFLLDLTHGLTQDLGHGLHFKLTHARSGLKALARVLERWVAHLLGVAITVQPEQQVSDTGWRWHVGLDAQATALLNDLYQGLPVEPERLQRLLSLFRLEFNDPREMRADVRGKPVYLGLAMTQDNGLRIKPQNLLLNLPLAASN